MLKYYYKTHLEVNRGISSIKNLFEIKVKIFSSWMKYYFIARILCPTFIISIAWNIYYKSLIAWFTKAFS